MLFRNEMFKTKSKIRFIRSLLNIVVARFTMRINFPNDRIAHRSLMRYIWKRDERVSIRKRRDLPGSKYRRVQHCSILTRFFPYRRCVYFSTNQREVGVGVEVHHPTETNSRCLLNAVYTRLVCDSPLVPRARNFRPG